MILLLHATDNKISGLQIIAAFIWRNVMAQKVERKSLVDQVYDLILKKIQNRELVPGDRLMP